MKKLFLCSLLLITLGVCARPYDHSLGISGGMFNGVSYKALVGEHLAVQTDLGVHLTIFDNVNLSFMANPMLMYQSAFYSSEVCEIDFFAGGGLSIGFSRYNYIHNNDTTYYYYDDYESVGGEFGLNGITGIEFAFNKAPMALSFDFRPGYGLFYGYDVEHCFDWGVNLGMRFYL